MRTSSVARAARRGSGRAACLSAGTAGADRVEHVGAQLEPFGVGEIGEGTIELGFELMGEVHVGHRTTRPAREVVMVADEGFGQLEAGKFPDAGHAMDDALGLENGEIAIHAARALPGSPHDDLVDGERPPGGRERLDQIAPSARVAAVVVGETRRYGFVKLGLHDRSIPMLSVIPVLDILERATIPCGV
jgi:hypothetical protein